MPTIKDRIDLTDTEKGIFDALLQANKQVSSYTTCQLCMPCSALHGTTPAL